MGGRGQRLGRQTHLAPGASDDDAVMECAAAELGDYQGAGDPTVVD